MFLALAIAAIAGPARGHQAPSGWEYDPWCCNGRGPHGDCAPVVARHVRSTAEGYVVTIRPGEHPMVRDHEVTHTIPYRDPAVRPSGDAEFHICLFPTAETVRCFYAPPMGF